MGRRRRGTNKKNKADGGGGAKQTEGRRPGGGSTVETDVAGMIENHASDFRITVNYVDIDAIVQELKDKRSDEECPLCLEPLNFDKVCVEGSSSCCNCGTRICGTCQRNRNVALAQAIVKKGGVFDWKNGEASLPRGTQLGKAVEQLVFCCPICRFDSRGGKGTQQKALLENVSKGRAWAQFVHGFDLLKEGEKQAGIDLLKKSADQGHTLALFFLGFFYYKGDFGIEKSVEEAKRYLHRANDLGCSEGSMSLSEICKDEGDEVGTIEYLKIAANRGNAMAHALLAHETEKDDKEAALQLLLVGAELGCVDCQSKLGKLCANNVFGLRYLSMAAELKDFESICDLALNLLQNNDDHEGRFGGSFSEGLLWGRRAVGLNEWESGVDKAFFGASFESMEEKARLSCFNCGASAIEKNTSFGRCTQCACAYYCGRSCQVQHWRNGHKTKCCSFNAKKDFGTMREFIESNEMIKISQLM
mmetsp:Transcript_13945/g.40082  ORF Transcript_13945/g.40082 Transcript_13945/m.40082 type:complete len:475 (-) Transcript_13945:5-1429(-)|eukprot:CAMPEP_0181021092 /NCGR_PEP_ID=MMETSP1070-20121207/798_1 /TAXON_ID=265543 /ORGANISM="Minutocellus polymorphus, Strain NH13" /LENGTH=474 /DNA_ID=CAMNT_0023097947 /DNA_START=64 /DNA_END=1488 /DNA_ORIENTATION=-